MLQRGRKTSVPKPKKKKRSLVQKRKGRRLLLAWQGRDRGEKKIHLALRGRGKNEYPRLARERHHLLLEEKAKEDRITGSRKGAKGAPRRETMPFTLKKKGGEGIVYWQLWKKKKR